MFVEHIPYACHCALGWNKKNAADIVPALMHSDMHMECVQQTFANIIIQSTARN